MTMAEQEARSPLTGAASLVAFDDRLAGMEDDPRDLENMSGGGTLERDTGDALADALAEEEQEEERRNAAGR